jgi:dephospho-CoA kinase
LEIKLNEQYIVGVTGTIGSGKSYLTKLICQNLVVDKLPTTHIDLDKIAHELTYSEKYKNNQEVQNLRKATAQLLKVDNTLHDIRAALLARIFKDHALNKKLQELYKPTIVREIRKQLANKKGLILMDGALLVDMNLQYLCNNNVLVINSDLNSIYSNLRTRGHDDKEILTRLDAQLTTERKLDLLHESERADRHGHAIIINNGRNTDLYRAASKETKLQVLEGILKQEGFWTAIGHQDFTSECTSYDGWN